MIQRAHNSIDRYIAQQSQIYYVDRYCCNDINNDALWTNQIE